MKILTFETIYFDFYYTMAHNWRVRRVQNEWKSVAKYLTLLVFNRDLH